MEFNLYIIRLNYISDGRIHRSFQEHSVNVLIEVQKKCFIIEYLNAIQ